MTPAARLIIEGRDVSTMMFGQDGPLISLTVTDEAGLKSDTLELSLDNREGFKAPKKGAEIQVWLGYEPTPVYMGLFTVDTWRKSGPVRTLTISAKAAELTTDIKAAKVRSFDGKTVDAIVKSVAGDHGLTATVASDFASITIDHIDQQTESDVGFLSRLARRVGATFKLADGKVIFAAKGSSALPSGGEKVAITLTPNMVSDWDAESQDRGSYACVSCSYMDHGKGKRVSVKAGSGKPQHRDRRTYGSKAEAEAAAKAQLGDLTRGKMSFSTNGAGMPSVFAEAKVTAAGFDPDVDGDFNIKTVTHCFDGSAYRTSISMETAGGDTGSGS